MKSIIIIAILIIFLISGCIDQTDNSGNGVTTASTDPLERCVEVCKELQLKDVDLNLGTCLSETEGLSWEIEDWACDVAHKPKKTIDDVSQYQCQECRKEEVTNFVEVTPNCEFIRKGPCPQ